MRLILSSLAALLVLPACVVERDYSSNRSERDRGLFETNSPFDDDEFNEDEWQDNYAEQQLPISTGRVTGDIGSVTSFDAPADNIASYSDGYWSNVAVTAYDNNQRMGMVILDVSGIDLRTAAPGRYTASSVDGTVDGPGTDGDESIYCTGCSGDGTNSYDAPGECDITVSVTPEGDREVVVEVALPTDAYDGTTTDAVGTFVITQ